MSFLAADDNAFALQGPRPEIPAGWLDTYWILAVIFILVLGGAALAIRALLRRQTSGQPPRRALELAITRAELENSEASVLALIAALRAYLAATDARAGLALSTEELGERLRELPVFLPARQTLLGLLRAADEAKFAAAPLNGALLIAGVRDALGRVEHARPLFRKESA